MYGYRSVYVKTSQHRNGWCRYRGRAVITIGYYRLQVARKIKQGTDVNEFDNAALLLTTEGNLSRVKARASATMISGMVVLSNRTP